MNFPKLQAATCSTRQALVGQPRRVLAVWRFKVWAEAEGSRPCGWLGGLRAKVGRWLVMGDQVRSGVASRAPRKKVRTGNVPRPASRSKRFSTGALPSDEASRIWLGGGLMLVGCVSRRRLD